MGLLNNYSLAFTGHVSHYHDIGCQLGFIRNAEKFTIYENWWLTVLA